MPGGQSVQQHDPGPGTPTRVLQQFDSDLIVINEAGHPVLFSSLGLSEMFRHHHIGEENVENTASAQVWDGHFFCFKCNQRFYVTDSFEEEDFCFFENEVTYFTDPEAYLPEIVWANMRIHVICAMMAMETECMCLSGHLTKHVGLVHQLSNNSHGTIVSVWVSNAQTDNV
jgi:hypothetical protein